MDLIRARTCTSRPRVSAAIAREGDAQARAQPNLDETRERKRSSLFGKNVETFESRRSSARVLRLEEHRQSALFEAQRATLGPLPASPRVSAMVSEIRVLHGGDIAREVARGLVSCLASRSRPTRIFEMAEYLTSGFDLVDVSEAPETPLETASHAYVLVVETAEFENPADGAVTLLRDLLAANKKTKTTPRRWEVRSVENASQETTRKTASSSDASSDATEARTEPMTRRVRFAVIAVGDTDVMAERAAFRSKQHCASDCNQAGQLADRLFAASGGVRIAPRLEMDVSRDAAEAQTNEWVDRTLLPALARAEG